MLKRREECDTYLTHVRSRDSPEKRLNIRKDLWLSSAVDVESTQPQCWLKALHYCDVYRCESFLTFLIISRLQVFLLMWVHQHAENKTVIYKCPRDVNTSNVVSERAVGILRSSMPRLAEQTKTHIRISISTCWETFSRCLTACARLCIHQGWGLSHGNYLFPHI